MTDDGDILEVISDEIGRHASSPLEAFRGRDGTLNARIYRNLGKRTYAARDPRVDGAAVEHARRGLTRAAWLRSGGVRVRTWRKPKPRRQRCDPRMPGAVSIVLRLRRAGYPELVPAILGRFYPEYTLLAVFRAINAPGSVVPL